MAVSVIRTAWSGTSGGPGLTQFFITEASGTFLTPTNAQTAVNAVRTFWDAIKANLPDEIVLTVSPVIDTYNESNGDLIGSTSAATAPTSVTGTSAGLYAMAAGLKVNLTTGVIRDKRRVRGAIYIVPASSAVMTANGNASSTVRTSINTAADALRTTLSGTGLPWVVYSRERQAAGDLPYRAGAHTLVSAVDTNEKIAILRGRRD